MDILTMTKLVWNMRIIGQVIRIILNLAASHNIEGNSGRDVLKCLQQLIWQELHVPSSSLNFPISNWNLFLEAICSISSNRSRTIVLSLTGLILTIVPMNQRQEQGKEVGRTNQVSQQVTRIKLLKIQKSPLPNPKRKQEKRNTSCFLFLLGVCVCKHLHMVFFLKHFNSNSHFALKQLNRKADKKQCRN